MKVRLLILAALLFFTFPMEHVKAKSYTIDDVQIRGWLDSNGTLLVNELFTYSFDGEFSKLRRTFPAKHRGQIIQFEAYEVTGGNANVGEVPNEKVRKLNSEYKNSTWNTEISQKDGSIQVLYLYYMTDAVVSYDTYSDLNITYFEQGSNHDTDLRNVEISYVLPGEVGETNIHGFFHDLHADVTIRHSDGIIFKTPVSKAYTQTATRVLFPSGIMKGQKKSEEPMPLEEAIKQEQQLLDQTAWRIGMIPAVERAAKLLAIIIGMLSLPMLWMRYRGGSWISRLLPSFGSVNYVLKTDPLYLSFVDHLGSFYPRSFLAGLFSLAEKDLADVRLVPAAERFRRQTGSPEKTLLFEWRKEAGKRELLPIEQELFIWLFRGKLFKQRFHLHDAAGASENENPIDYRKKQHTFQRNHANWHQGVADLLVESGTLSKRLPFMLKSFILVLLGLYFVIALYIDSGEFWSLVIPGVLLVIALRDAKGRLRKWPPILYALSLVFVASTMLSEELSHASQVLAVVAVLCYFAIPQMILRSRAACYAKISMNKFRSQMLKGLPEGLTAQEQEQWVARAYLLNRSNKQMPRVRADEQAAALTALFALPQDPLQFVHSTWGPPPQTKAVASSSSGGSTDSGGYSGGGGFDGGGGAGAD